MKFIDPKLGVPLPERGYGGNCLIYDPDNKTDPYHNLWVSFYPCNAVCFVLLCFMKKVLVFSVILFRDLARFTFSRHPVHGHCSVFTFPFK